MKTVVVLRSDQMGAGDRELGLRILRTFLQKSSALGELSAIVLYNSGVQLVAASSPLLAELTLLYEAGVDVLPCGTCLSHYGLEPAVGAVSDMDAIVRELGAAEKVITL